MVDDSFDIVIVGAGIAGAALANMLANTKLRIAIVDAGQIPAARPPVPTKFNEIDARVLALTEASKAVLEAAGVWADIADISVSAYKKMSVWDAEGTGVVDFDAAEVDAVALGTIVENRAVVWALQQRLAFGAVRLFSQRRLNAVCYENECAVLELDDGSELKTCLLVGADGAASAVRKYVNVDCHEINNRQKAIVCHIETALNHDDVARQRFLATGPLALLPVSAVGANVCSIVWSCDTDYADSLLALNDNDFCRQLGIASEGVLGDITAATPRLAFPLIARHAVSYTAPHTVLIGDAAHVVHPLAGQGINLGLSDVAVLAEQLQVAVSKGVAIDSPRVLAAYQRHRRGDNLRMIALTQTFRHLFAQDALPLRWLRNYGMNAINSQPALKRTIIKQAMGV